MTRRQRRDLSSSQAAAYQHVYTTHDGGFTLSFNAERQAAREAVNTNFKSVCLTQPGIESQSTASAPDALSSQPRIGYIMQTV